MRKLFITAAVLGVGITESQALTALQPLCCVGTLLDNCSQFECTYGGTTRYFTNCGSCTDMRQLEMKGPYKPCGNFDQSFDSSYGECVLGSIVLPTECTAGTYGRRGICQPCPDGGTSADGSTVITDCYIPAGTGGSDNTGKWEYVEDCHYSN